MVSPAERCGCACLPCTHSSVDRANDRRSALSPWTYSPLRASSHCRHFLLLALHRIRGTHLKRRECSCHRVTTIHLPLPSQSKSACAPPSPCPLRHRNRQSKPASRLPSSTETQSVSRPAPSAGGRRPDRR